MDYANRSEYGLTQAELYRAAKQILLETGGLDVKVMGQFGGSLSLAQCADFRTKVEQVDYLQEFPSINNDISASRMYLLPAKSALRVLECLDSDPRMTFRHCFDKDPCTPITPGAPPKGLVTVILS
jgi:hypothetical protein